MALKFTEVERTQLDCTTVNTYLRRDFALNAPPGERREHRSLNDQRVESKEAARDQVRIAEHAARRTRPTTQFHETPMENAAIDEILSARALLLLIFIFT